MNYKKVMRYIRLNSLVPELQDMVDGVAVNSSGEPMKKLGFIPAVELSFIRPKNQQLIAVSIEGEQASPSVAQAKSSGAGSSGETHRGRYRRNFK